MVTLHRFWPGLGFQDEPGRIRSQHCHPPREAYLHKHMAMLILSKSWNATHIVLVGKRHQCTQAHGCSIYKYISTHCCQCTKSSWQVMVEHWLGWGRGRERGAGAQHCCEATEGDMETKERGTWRPRKEHAIQAKGCTSMGWGGMGWGGVAFGGV